MPERVERRMVWCSAPPSMRSYSSCCSSINPVQAVAVLFSQRSLSLHGTFMLALGSSKCNERNQMRARIEHEGSSLDACSIVLAVLQNWALLLSFVVPGK